MVDTLTSTTLRICTVVTSFCIIPLTIALIWTIAERCCLPHHVSASTPAAVRKGTKRLWIAKLLVCICAFIMAWFSLSTYLVGSYDYECYILGTIVPMVYVFTKFMMYIFLWFKNRLVRPMSPVSKLEKLLFVATCGVIPFMGVIGTFIHGVVLQDVCFVEPPGELSASMLCIDVVLSFGYVMLFTQALRDSLSRVAPLAAATATSSAPPTTGTNTNTNVTTTGGAFPLPPPTVTPISATTSLQPQQTNRMTTAGFSSSSNTSLPSPQHATGGITTHVIHIASSSDAALPPLPDSPAATVHLMSPTGTGSAGNSPAQVTHNLTAGTGTTASGGTHHASSRATTATHHSASNALAADELSGVIRKNFRACVAAVISTFIVMSWVTIADWGLTNNLRTLKLITCTAGVLDLTFDVMIVLHAARHKSDRSPSSSRHKYRASSNNNKSRNRREGSHNGGGRDSENRDGRDGGREWARSATPDRGHDGGRPNSEQRDRKIHELAMATPAKLAAPAPASVPSAQQLATPNATATNRISSAISPPTPLRALKNAQMLQQQQQAQQQASGTGASVTSPLVMQPLQLPPLPSSSPLPSPYGMASPGSTSYQHHHGGSSGGQHGNLRALSSRMLPLPSSRHGGHTPTVQPHSAGGRTYRSGRGDGGTNSMYGNNLTLQVASPLLSVHHDSRSPTIPSPPQQHHNLMPRFSSRPAPSYDPDTPMDEDEARMESDSPLHVHRGLTIATSAPFMDHHHHVTNRRGSIVAQRAETPLPRVSAQLILTSPVSASRTFLNPNPLCRSPSFPPGTGTSPGGQPTSGRKSARGHHHNTNGRPRLGTGSSMTMAASATSPRQLPPQLQH